MISLTGAVNPTGLATTLLVPATRCCSRWPGRC
jgi:hypothetical protein